MYASGKEKYQGRKGCPGKERSWPMDLEHGNWRDGRRYRQHNRGSSWEEEPVAAMKQARRQSLLLDNRVLRTDVMSLRQWSQSNHSPNPFVAPLSPQCKSTLYRPAIPSVLPTEFRSTISALSKFLVCPESPPRSPQSQMSNHLRNDR